MKVSLTSEEFKAILSCHFRCEVSEFTIIEPDPSLLGKYLRLAVINPLDKNYFIDNIKGLRKYVSDMGSSITLPEGKWALENWPMFIRFVDEFNRLPNRGFGCGDTKGKLV